MTVPLSRWTMPVLRIGMGVFLALWGIDKIAATDGAQRIFSHFYGLELGAAPLYALGAAQVALGLALAVGWLRVPVAWLALAVNAVSTGASWRQILDPWGWFGIGPGGTHLFLASIVIMAANIVLVLNARDATASLDGRLAGSGAVERGSPAAAGP